MDERRLKAIRSFYGRPIRWNHRQVLWPNARSGWRLDFTGGRH